MEKWIHISLGEKPVEEGHVITYGWFSLPQNEAQSMKTAPPEASMGIMLAAMDGNTSHWGAHSQLVGWKINTVMAAFDHSASKTQYKCFILNCIQGVKSGIITFPQCFSTLVEDFYQYSTHP